MSPNAIRSTARARKVIFDRINAAVYEMLTECDSYTREEVLRQAEKWNVCPHEFQFDVASWVDGVICDYNYAFDPTSK